MLQRNLKNVLMDDSLNQLIKLFDLAESLEKNFRNSVLWERIYELH